MGHKISAISIFLFAGLIFNSAVFAGTSIGINHSDIDPAINELSLSGINFDAFGQPTVTIGDTVLAGCTVLANKITCSIVGTPAQNVGVWKVKVSAGNSPNTNAEIDVFNRAGLVSNGCIPGDMVECYSGEAATRGIGDCQTGYRVCGNNGEWSDCQGETLPQLEECTSSADEDCDELVGLNDPDCGDYCSAQGLEQCGNSCVDVLTEINNCGSCGNVCDYTEECVAGICTCFLSVEGVDPPYICEEQPPSTITVLGRGFVSGAIVFFDGTAVSASSVNEENLIFELPNPLPGINTYSISVMNSPTCYETIYIDVIQCN